MVNSLKEQEPLESTVYGLLPDQDVSDTQFDDEENDEGNNDVQVKEEDTFELIISIN